MLIPSSSLSHLESIIIQPLFIDQNSRVNNALSFSIRSLSSLTSIRFTEHFRSYESVDEYLPSIQQLTVLDLGPRNYEVNSKSLSFDYTNNNNATQRSFNPSNKLKTANIDEILGINTQQIQTMSLILIPVQT